MMLSLLPHARAGALLLTLAMSASAQSAELTEYQPVHAVTGTIRIWGSPQMGDLLRLYEQGFAQLQPAVRFDNDLKSTITAVAGVYTGRAEIGLLGREIWPTEVQAFASVAGHAPMAIDVATGSFDVPKATFALMVFVPKANPVTNLSTEQLERIFAASDRPLRTWGELGLTGAWASRPIHLYGFNIDNDKSQIFSQLVFRKDQRWNAALHEFNNAGALDAGQLIVQAVAGDPDGIGISNVHYATPAVKALALSTSDQAKPITPSRETVANRSYPLTRAVYMVVDSDAAHPPNTAVAEFLRYVLSRQGAQAVLQEGNYLPLPPAVALRQLQLLPPVSGPRK
jgi:phosphate transport system substrate-binding protein